MANREGTNVKKFSVCLVLFLTNTIAFAQSEKSESTESRNKFEILKDGRRHEILEMTRAEWAQIRHFNVCQLENGLTLPQCLEMNEEDSLVIRLIE